jgi:hypothetical protein
MDDYSDLFSQHEPDPLLRELNGNILWYWKPMNPNDKRMGCVSNAPFEAVGRIKTLEAALYAIQNYDRDTPCYDARDLAAVQDIAFAALSGEKKDG